MCGIYRGVGRAAKLVVLAVVGVMVAGCMQALPTDPALREAAGTFGVAATPTPAAAVAETPAFESALPPPAEEPTPAAPPPAEEPPAEEPTPAAPPPAEEPASVFAPPPTPTVEIIIELAPAVDLSSEERWRRQQLDRQPFAAIQTYYTNGSDLWWYDPINQQHVIVGTFDGQFAAQARFVLRDQGAAALEVPYRINQSYGLTAISPAIVERMRAAGYTEWVETYVIETPDVFGG